MRSPTARELAALSVAVTALSGVAVLLVAHAPRWWGGEGGSYAPRALATGTRVAPRYSLFGDVVTLRAHVLVDRRVIEPSGVRLETRFTPFRLTSQTRRVRAVGDNAGRIDYEFQLQCMTLACLRAAGRIDEDGEVHPTPIGLRPARVVYERRDGASESTALTWPQILVRPRLTAEEIRNGEARVGRFPTVSRSYTVPPDLVGALLLAAGVLLALGGSYLLADALRGRIVPLRRRVPEHLTPLQRALLLVRDAAANDDAVEGRKALERLTAELRRGRELDLASFAGRLAWSHEPPQPAALNKLVADVERSLDGR